MISRTYIERPGLSRLAVAVLGEDPEILFIHGCTETAAIWLPLMQAMADAGVGTAAVDLRGHGHSDGHEALQDAGIEDYVEDARSVLAHMPTLRVAVGHSMGGLVTQLLASRCKLEHAVLIASSPTCGMKTDGMRMARKHVWTFLMASLRRSFKRLYADEAVVKSLLFHTQTPIASVRRFMAQQQEDSWRAGNEMNTLLPDPSAVRCPVTVIGGSDDFMVSHESTEATASAYGTKAIYMDRCAHMVPLEADPIVLAQKMLAAVRSIGCNS
ncbi:MAG: alpha/beta fold hydrolase [Betaproteobacteria bacterium]